MPKISKHKNHWRHPLYSIGYCFERYGKVYLRVKDKMRATPLIWHEDNKEDALQLLSTYIENEVFEIDNSSMLLSTLIEKFFAQLKHKVSIQTYKQYETQLKYLIHKDFEISNSIEIRSHIQENLLPLYSNYSKAYIYKVLMKASTLFKFAVDNEIMAKNPILKSMFPVVDTPEKYTPKTDEYEMLISYLKSKPKLTRLRQICEFITLTGLRSKEVSEIRVTDIKKSYLLVRGKKHNISKNNERRFPFGLFKDLDLLITEILESNYGNDKLFGLYDLNSPRRQLKASLKVLDINEFGFHGFRRLAIHRWKMMGINRTDRALLAGHDEAIQKASYDFEEEILSFANRIKSQMKEIT